MSNVREIYARKEDQIRETLTNPANWDKIQIAKFLHDLNKLLVTEAEIILQTVPQDKWNFEQRDLVFRAVRIRDSIGYILHEIEGSKRI